MNSPMRSFHRARRVAVHLSYALVFTCLLPLAACSRDTAASSAIDEQVAEEVARSWEEEGVDAPHLEVASEILQRVEAGEELGSIAAAGVPLYSTRTLPAFYRDRVFLPAWIEQEGLSGRGREVLGAVRGAARDGLRPQDYHLAVLDSLVRIVEDAGPGRATHLAELDLLLTDAFLLYASHLLHGRLDPLTMEPDWTASGEEADMRRVLEEGVSGEVAIANALSALRPYGDRYDAMRDVLSRYEAIVEAGGWEPVPEGGTLDPEMRSARVEGLRRRLEAAGELEARTTDRDLYDPEMVTVVRDVQARFGLEADGRVGRATLAALNVPAERRLEQLLVNLERWRWMPLDLGERYILVNIPGFFVSVVEGGEELMRLRAIVGREYRRTPVFSGTMTYLALAPYWNVPPGIARNDQLPRIRSDPDYLASQRMSLFETGSHRPVDPASVDWAELTGPEFNRRFWLRQEPGPNNALGNVKFMFPNRHNVYLHDTPSRELFAQATRDFSSGCIRVDRALELAEHLLRDDPSWTMERIRRVVAGGEETPVTLPRSYEVHLQYFTAWVEADGTLQLRDDIYARDARVLRALEERPSVADTGGFP